MLSTRSVFHSWLLAMSALGCTAALASDAQLHPQNFQLRRTIIEAPNGTGTEATDVNNAGIVVGAYNAPQGRAFAWTRRGGFVDLEGVTTAEFSLAHAVNECGQVVGELDNHAVRWNTFDEIEDLGTLGGVVSSAGGINDRGDVVGFSQLGPSGRGTPFLWTEKQGMRSIVSCEGASGVASAINNRREVVGSCDDAVGQPQAFFWSEQTDRIDLHLPGFTNSSALGINDRGEVVGVAVRVDPEFVVVAFKWLPRNQRVVFLKALGDDFDFAKDINKWGWTVGDAVDGAGVRRVAAWLTPRHGFLVDPGLGSFSFASALNDRGSIAGTISLGGSNLRAVLWEPPPIVARALSKRGVGRCLRAQD